MIVFHYVIRHCQSKSDLYYRQLDNIFPVTVDNLKGQMMQQLTTEEVLFLIDFFRPEFT